MLETPLDLQPLLDGDVLLRLVIELPFAVFDLIKGPEAGLDGEVGDLDGSLRLAPPSPEARREDVHELGPLDFHCLLDLGHEVPPAVGRGLGDIGDVMSRHDFGEVFAELRFPRDDLARGRGGRRGSPWGRAGTLNPGVHVGFVVVADVEHIVPSLHRPGESLQPDVVGPAVAAERDEFHVLVLGPGGELSLFLEGLIRRLDAAHDRGGVLERGVDVGHPPGAVREDRRRHLEAPRREGNDDGLVHRHQHLLDRDDAATSGARAMSRRHAALFLREFFQFNGH